MNEEANKALTRARTHLLIDQPFFGTLVMRLAFVEDSKITQLAVNGKEVRYNPEFVNSFGRDGFQVLKSALAHEVMHCVLSHCGESARGAGHDPKRWNQATDFVVNQMLKDAGFTLGEDWLLDSQYKDMTAEHVYKLLPENDGDGQGQGDNGIGDPLDDITPGTSDPSEQAQQEADWQLATSQAAEAAKAQGKLPESLQHLVETLRKPKVDWKSELRHFVSRVAAGDYSWARPNRMMQAAGFMLPGLYSEEIGSIVIAIDESGSVDLAITEAFAAEISAIKEDLRPEKTVLLHFDSEVGKVEEFGPDDEFKMVRYCQGGTDFRPPVQAAQDLPTQPMCLIVLTDLYGPFPESPPDFPVLWVSINHLEAPWGQTLHIEV